MTHAIGRTLADLREAHKAEMRRCVARVDARGVNALLAMRVPLVAEPPPVPAVIPLDDDDIEPITAFELADDAQWRKAKARTTTRSPER